MKRNRRCIRLKGYDYSLAGAYFVSICVQNRACLFAEIINGKIVLTNAGRMVNTVWDELPEFYPGIDIDAFQIMPNHIHGIIILGNETHEHPNVRATPRGRPDLPCGRPNMDAGQPRGIAHTMSLPDVVHRFKTMTTKRYTDGVKQYGWSRFDRRLWQRNYYEHIIRNDNDLNRIREYIINNPAKWDMDRENPLRPHK